MNDNAINNNAINDIGVIGGTGNIGSAIAARLAAAGMRVTIGSRSIDRAQQTAAKLSVDWSLPEGQLTGADLPQAATACIVVIAAPWPGSVETAEHLRPQLHGKLVLSTTNRLTFVNGELVPVTADGTSAARALQAALPESNVVTAFNHIPFTALGNASVTLNADVLLCGNSAEAVATAAEIVSRIKGLRPVPAGSIAVAGAVEDFTAVLVNVNRRLGIAGAVSLVNQA